MKKIICVIITVVLLSIMIIGCSNQKIEADDSMFITVNNEIDFYVVYEKDTKVLNDAPFLVGHSGEPMRARQTRWYMISWTI